MISCSVLGILHSGHIGISLLEADQRGLGLQLVLPEEYIGALFTMGAFQRLVKTAIVKEAVGIGGDSHIGPGFFATIRAIVDALNHSGRLF